MVTFLSGTPNRWQIWVTCLPSANLSTVMFLSGTPNHEFHVRRRTRIFHGLRWSPARPSCCPLSFEKMLLRESHVSIFWLMHKTYSQLLFRSFIIHLCKSSLCHSSVPCLAWCSRMHQSRYQLHSRIVFIPVRRHNSGYMYSATCLSKQTTAITINQMVFSDFFNAAATKDCLPCRRGPACSYWLFLHWCKYFLTTSLTNPDPEPLYESDTIALVLISALSSWGKYFWTTSLTTPDPSTCANRSTWMSQNIYKIREDEPEPGTSLLLVQMIFKPRWFDSIRFSVN